MRVAMTCGYRVPGLYVCERPVDDGSPLEAFIQCPPLMVDMEAIGLSATGMRILERYDYQGNKTGVFDLWDWVGEGDNPWPTDFLEQTRWLGTSRRFPAPLVNDPNFKLLKAHPFDPTLSSRHIYVHAKALLEDPEPFYRERTGIKFCPQGIEGHNANETTWETCAALWWEMVEAAKKDEPRRHKVYLPRDWEKYGAPSCSYAADHQPLGVNPKFLPGIIMSIPLSGIEIPMDNSGEDEHERLAKLLNDGGWQYNCEITED